MDLSKIIAVNWNFYFNSYVKESLYYEVPTDNNERSIINHSTRDGLANVFKEVNNC